MTTDEADGRAGRAESSSVLAALKHFSSCRAFRLLACLFLLMLLINFDFYVFVFLAEKFSAVSIQSANFTALFSALVGNCLFMCFLRGRPRRVLNFTISGGVLGLSLVVLVASLALPRASVDAVGLVCLCKQCARLTESFLQDFRGLGIFLLLPV